MKSEYKLGYIDEDIKQVKLYRRKLEEHGFEVVGYKFKKGMSLEGLMKQVYKSNIDLLMIDYKLNESNIVSFNGEEVEGEIYENKPLFPHIIFTNKVDQAEPFIEDWKIIFDKDDIFEDTETVDKFVNTLKRSIEQYIKYVSKKKKIILDLLEKGKETPLNASEKNILLSTQEEIFNLDKTKKREVPMQLLSYQKLDELSKTRKDAEEFLQNLINKSKKK